MSTEHGEARDYDGMQAVMRQVADKRNISRREIDRIALLPAGYAEKTLAEIPERRLGPATMGAMNGALGIKWVAVDDPDALAKHTARGDLREYKTGFHSTAVHFRISLRKLKRNGRKGGKNSRKFVGKRKARQLARKAARARWHPPKLIETPTEELNNGRHDINHAAAAQSANDGHHSDRRHAADLPRMERQGKKGDAR